MTEDVKNKVLAGAILAGLSGLVIAGGTLAQVKTLEEQQATAQAAQIKIREDIASLKTSVKNIEKSQEKQGEDLEDIDDKLDELLSR